MSKAHDKWRERTPSPPSTTLPKSNAANSANNPNSARETVESIAVAIVLAFLFRGFVAEAFVIPTGSMAPTLQGNHKDVVCEKCGHAYQAGASVENDDQMHPETVVATTCPICRYTMELDWSRNKNQATFSGDRILVSKFSYELSEPERWDVIVFKFPNNAKQNYIKRLIGLPGETVRIHGGDIYIKAPDSDSFTIARKPPAKILAMLQAIDDTKHIPAALVDVKWPSRWQPWKPNWLPKEWRTCGEDREGLRIQASDEETWYRYRHLVPRSEDWEAIENRELPGVARVADDVGHLITDFCAYNAYTTEQQRRYQFQTADVERHYMGMHWVGDLAVECEVDIQSASGLLLLDLVESGQHFRGEIDVETGAARIEFRHLDGSIEELAKTAAGGTTIRGKGRHSLRMANVDDQICLWVDGRLVLQAEYSPQPDVGPQWKGLKDPLDLSPVGIGGQGIEFTATRAQVYRDVYYVAAKPGQSENDYIDQYYTGHGTERPVYATIADVFADPRRWNTTTLFKSRKQVDFKLEKDQFFPMGDNSPQSLDGRLWGDPAYVERKLLTGKALMVYWPHMWNAPIPLMPNIGRMRLIH